MQDQENGKNLLNPKIGPLVYICLLLLALALVLVS